MNAMLINSVFDIVNLQFQALDVNGTFLFIVISYFLGLVFQEVGSFLSKSIFFRKNKLLHTAMRSKENDPYLMSEAEMKLLKKKLKDERGYENNNADISYIYNYCKSYCFEHCDVSLIDKDQSIAAMSRSLSVFFSALSLFIFIVVFFNDGIGYIWLVPVSMFLSVLMFIRFRRFTIIRYVRILRAYLYQKGGSDFMLYNEFREQAEMYYDNAVSKYNNGNYVGAYQDFNMAKCIAEKNNMNGLVEMINAYLQKLRERSI